MVRFAICDDDPAELDHTKSLVQKYLDVTPRSAGRIYTFSSPEQLLRKAGEEQGFDVYILDILMPEMSGIELGSRLRENGEEGQIIYLSTSRDYAVESYDTGAFFYLIKPVLREKLFSVLDSAVQRAKEKNSHSIEVHTPGGLCRVDFDDLLFVEQQDRAMHYHLADGTTVISCVIRKAFLTEAEPILADERFCTCGSSFVLNLHRIRAVAKNTAEFCGGTKLALPITLQHEVRKKWMEYWLEREENV